ncbi:MAG: hemolysin III family protein [Chitinophagales bacterium]
MSSNTKTLSAVELRKEIANSITHGIGLLFGIVAMPILIAVAASSGNVKGMVGAGIYGFSFLMVFGFSTLYHSIKHPTVKRVLQTIDHISIYFLIAGSYTPFILAYMYNGMGFTLLSILWGLTFIGIFYKIFFLGRFKIVSTVIYLIMGWMLLVVLKPFIADMDTSTIVLLTTGGGLYTLGVVFFLWKKLTYHHAIWHVFVLAAAVCHFVAVLTSLH